MSEPTEQEPAHRPVCVSCGEEWPCSTDLHARAVHAVLLAIGDHEERFLERDGSIYVTTRRGGPMVSVTEPAVVAALRSGETWQEILPGYLVRSYEIAHP